jgi:NAD(P)-dependent dehydrogenase (short-subunit alcohol dehydrogenase family)
MTDPKEIAEVAAFLCPSQSSFNSGSSLDVTGGEE